MGKLANPAGSGESLVVLELYYSIYAMGKIKLDKLKKLLNYPFPLIAAALLLFMSIGITKPPCFAFSKSGEVFFNTVAEMHITYGLWYTKGQDFLAYGKPYGHHPPALGLTLAMLINLFDKGFPYSGVTFSRLIMILFHLGSLYVLIKILKTLGEDILFIWVFGLFYCVSPISNFFGKNVCHETPTMFFMLLAIYHYILGIKSEKRSQYNIVAITVSLVVGCFFGWPVFFLAGTMAAYEYSCKKNNKLLKYIVLSCASAAFAISAQLIWVGGIWRIIEGFNLRGGVTNNGYSINEWIIELIHHNKNNFTPQLHYMAIGGAILYIQHKKDKIKLFFLGSFTAVSLLHILVFSQGAWIHPYWQFYIIPVELYCAALCMVEILRSIESRVGIVMYCAAFFSSTILGMLNVWFNWYNGYRFYHPVITVIFNTRIIGVEPIYYITMCASFFVLMRRRTSQ